MIAKAFELAHKLHENQLDKRGRPYINHCIDVLARYMYEFPDSVSDIALCSCLLYDVLEDCDIRQHELWKQLGETIQCDQVVNTVAELTRRKDETYEHYMNHICESSLLVRRIKYCDLLVNLNGCEKSLEMRYAKALTKLSGVLNAHST